MQTQDLISLPESELVQQLKLMSLDELERHAMQIVKDLGSDNYAGLMRQAMDSLKSTSDSSQSQFERLQALVRDVLPNKAYMSDIYARLATIMMMVLSRKFDQALRNTAN